MILKSKYCGCQPVNTHYLVIKNVYFAGFQNSNYKTSRKPCNDVHESRLARLEFNFPNYLAQWREARCPELEADVTSRLTLLSQSTESVFAAFKQTNCKCKS